MFKLVRNLSIGIATCLLSLIVSTLLFQYISGIGPSAGQRAAYAAVVFWVGLSSLAGAFVGGLLFTAIRSRDEHFANWTMAIGLSHMCCLVVVLSLLGFFVMPLLEISIPLIVATLIMSLAIFGLGKLVQLKKSRAIKRDACDQTGRG